jgi:hypothetical protein
MSETTTVGKGHWSYVMDLNVEDLVFAERRAVAIKGGNPNTVTRANVLEHAWRRMGGFSGTVAATPIRNEAGVDAAKVGWRKSTIFGHPKTKVIMWMGAQGWTVTQASHVLKAVTGEVPSVYCVRTFVRAGRIGGNCERRGAVPKLTKDQQKQLKALLPKE